MSGNTWHCSDHCRFMSKVDKSEAAGACWLWLADKNNDGYGVFVTYTRGAMKAHRAAVLLLTNDEPGELCVLHRCDVPACVNPAHLFLGTSDDNMADKKSKGRQHHPSGATNGQSKLTDEQVRSIREESAAGALRYVLAAKYGVSAPMISYIARGKAWKHLQ